MPPKTSPLYDDLELVYPDPVSLSLPILQRLLLAYFPQQKSSDINLSVYDGKAFIAFPSGNTGTRHTEIFIKATCERCDDFYCTLAIDKDGPSVFCVLEKEDMTWFLDETITRFSKLYHSIGEPVLESFSC